MRKNRYMIIYVFVILFLFLFVIIIAKKTLFPFKNPISFKKETYCQLSYNQIYSIVLQDKNLIRQLSSYNLVDSQPSFLNGDNAGCASAKRGDFINIVYINSNVHNFITHGSYYDTSPSFCFKGEKVVFQRNKNNDDSDGELWMVDRNGDNAIKIEKANQRITGRSPNCLDNMLTFASKGKEDNINIYMLNLNSNDKLKKITSTNDSLYPSFSPDGKYIIYTRIGQGLWITKIDATNHEQIKLPGENGLDNKKILYGFMGTDYKYLYVVLRDDYEGKIMHQYEIEKTEEH